MEFLSLSRRCSSVQNVPSGEERGETDVFAGWLDSFLSSSWFTATINTTVCSSRLFLRDLERHQYELDPVNVMFLNCLCSSMFLENSRVYFPFLSTDCLQWNNIPMMLVLFFLKWQWFGMIEQFCAINVCFPKIKTKTWCFLFCQHLNYKIISDRQVYIVNDLKQSWSLSLF